LESYNWLLVDLQCCNLHSDFILSVLAAKFYRDVPVAEMVFVMYLQQNNG